MERTELIKSLATMVGAIVAAVIGAIVAITGIWIKDILDKRKEIQAWYEQKYITEGVDRLLCYLKIEQVQLVTLLNVTHVARSENIRDFKPGVVSLPRDEAHEAFPLEALVRIETLLKHPIFTAAISSGHRKAQYLSTLSASERSPALLNSMTENSTLTYEKLLGLREELLLIKVKKKSDIHNVHKNEKVIAALKDLTEAAFRLVASTSERGDKIMSGQ